MPPSNMEQVKSILSDQTDSVFPVFRCGNKEDYVKTVAVGKISIFLRSPTTFSSSNIYVYSLRFAITGVFDVTNKKWYIYMEPPATSAPVAVIHLDL